MNDVRQNSKYAFYLQANIYLFKVNNRKTRKGSQICSNENNENTRTRTTSIRHPDVFIITVTLNIFDTLLLCFYC